MAERAALTWFDGRRSEREEWAQRACAPACRARPPPLISSLFLLDVNLRLLLLLLLLGHVDVQNAVLVAKLKTINRQGQQPNKFKGQPAAVEFECDTERDQNWQHRSLQLPTLSLVLSLVLSASLTDLAVTPALSTCRGRRRERCTLPNARSVRS